MIAILLGVFLDLLIGDPYNMPHPIKLMGHIINFEEKFVRKFFKTKKGLEFGGLIICLFNIALGFLPIYLLLSVLNKNWQLIISSIIIFFSLSARTLSYEAKQVKKALDISLEAGRNRVKYIVGRNPDYLDRQGIIKATVETVSENTSDGVIAPLFYAILLGPAGAMMYKFVNTMDSMLGYKNEKYLHLGRWPALIDDLYNFIPARITGYVMALTSFDYKKIKNNFRIIKRDHNKHSSPNAGYPESAISAILGVSLGGSQYYGSDYVVKPTIGEDLRPIESADINRACSVLFKTESIFLTFYVLVYLIYYSLSL